jgi:uncharacterized OsmC-like protein
MAEVQTVEVAKLKFQASCPNHARTDVIAGDDELIMDHPVPRGTGLGMSPIQAYLAGFMGCTNSTIHKLAKQAGTEVVALDLEMEVEMDRRGLMMQETIGLPFVSVTTTVNITTPATSEQLVEMKEGLSQWCPIAVTFKAAGTDVSEVWNVSKP